jgi:hypothetical protein
MAEGTEQTYLGLPIPDFQESWFLELHQADMFGDDVSIPVMANMLMVRNPMIGAIIKHDLNHWSQYEAGDNMDPEEALEYMSGIEAGYEFFIGFVGVVRYMRSGQTNLQSFLDTVPLHEGVSDIGVKERDRIKAVRSDKATIDVPAHGADITSSDLALMDASDYLCEAVRLQDLMTQETVRLEAIVTQDDHSGQAKRLAQSHVKGFKHGVANAIELYIQSREQKLIARLQ